MTDDKARGRFVWFDLVTPATEAAAKFYTAVTGWGTMQWQGPAPYTLWTNGGSPLGGIMSSPPDGKTSPHWLAYISSPDVDATVKAAVNLGARILQPATDIPTVGRSAIVADPQGAVFAVFTAAGEPPGHEGEPVKGEFSWHELMTHDYPAAFRFYEHLFGWQKLQAMDMGEVGIYQLFGRNGLTNGGMFNTPTPPAWLHYVMVDDVQRGVDVVKSEGGQILNGPMEVPGGDWIA